MQCPNYVYNILVLHDEAKEKIDGFINEYIDIGDEDIDMDFAKIMKHRSRNEDEYQYYANCLVSNHQALKLAEKDISPEVKRQLQLDFCYLLNPTLGRLNELNLSNKIPELALISSIHRNHVDLDAVTRETILRKLAKLSKNATLLDFSHLENDAEEIDLDTLIENKDDEDSVFVWSNQAFFRHEFLDPVERFENGFEQLFFRLNDNTLVLGIPSKNASCGELCEVLNQEYGFDVDHYFGNRLERSYLIYRDGKLTVPKKEASLTTLYTLLDSLGIWDSHCEYFGWKEDDLPNQVWRDEDNVYLPALGVE